MALIGKLVTTILGVLSGISLTFATGVVIVVFSGCLVTSTNPLLSFMEVPCEILYVRAWPPIFKEIFKILFISPITTKSKMHCLLQWKADDKLLQAVRLRTTKTRNQMVRKYSKAHSIQLISLRTGISSQLSCHVGIEHVQIIERFMAESLLCIGISCSQRVTRSTETYQSRGW